MSDIKDDATETPEINIDDVKEEDTQELGTEDNDVEPTDKQDVEDAKKQKESEDEPFDINKIQIETRGGQEEKIEYGEEIDPDDVKTVGTIVDKQTAGIKKQLQETADRLEVEAFVQEKPEYAKYKPVIMKYLQHPVYSKIPVKNIAAMVASNDLMKLGAKAERDAQAKANATKSGGNPVRTPQGGTIDWTKVSKAEFEEQKRRVLQGGF